MRGIKSWGFASCPFQTLWLGNLFNIPNNTELELSGSYIYVVLALKAAWPFLAKPLLFPCGFSAKATPDDF